MSLQNKPTNVYFVPNVQDNNSLGPVDRNHNDALQLEFDFYGHFKHVNIVDNC